MNIEAFNTDTLRKLVRNLQDENKKLKEKLDEERFQKSDMKRIRGAYMSNLPILRGRFLNSLLMGNVGEQEIQEKLNDYQIKLDGKYFIS